MSLKNPATSPGIDPGTVRLVAQRKLLLRICPNFAEIYLKLTELSVNVHLNQIYYI